MPKSKFDVLKIAYTKIFNFLKLPIPKVENQNISYLKILNSKNSLSQILRYKNA